jgi:hypothetical protein
VAVARHLAGNHHEVLAAMGYGDNRHTPKMRQRRSRAKLISRLKRKAAEVKATRAATKAAAPAETSKKSKAKKKADKS